MDYTKALKSVVFTLHDGTVTVADTLTSQAGSNAFADFLAGRDIDANGTYIPYGSVVKAVLSKSTESASKSDAWCTEEEADCVFAFSETVIVEDGFATLQYTGELGAVITVTFDGAVYEDVPGIEIFNEAVYPVGASLTIASEENAWLIEADDGEHTITVCSEQGVCSASFSETGSFEEVDGHWIATLAYDEFLSEYINVTYNGTEYQGVQRIEDAYGYFPEYPFIIYRDDAWKIEGESEGTFNISVCATGLLLDGDIK